jgi:hypoxanthine phosphoribosyltransferase
MIKVEDLYFEKYIENQEVISKTVEIANQINFDYVDKKPIFISVLNGSFMFAAELFKNLNIPCEICFVKVSSYVDLASTGTVKELIGLNQDIENRHVIIIEDIVDTGRTLHFLIDKMLQNKPLSIASATLLHKPAATIVKNRIEYIGFEIDNLFVLGFGLDYNGFGRNLDSIYVKKD